MIIYGDYRTQNTNITTWGKLQNGVYSELAPEEIAVDFIDTIEELRISEEIFISNLSFYKQDFIKALLISGFKFVRGNPKIKDMHEKDIKYLISGDGKIYNMMIKHKKKRISIYDADNLISLQDRGDIIETWGDKGVNNMTERYTRAILSALTDILEDTTMRSRPLTISACARRKWKKSYSINFDNYFPDANLVETTVAGKPESLESFLRLSYNGGFCYGKKDIGLNPQGEGMVLDCNSMYPHIMATMPLPYGWPHEFKGEPSKRIKSDSDKGYIYYFVRLRASFELKENKLPCVKVRDGKQILMHGRDWLTHSDIVNFKTGERIKSKTGDKKTTCELTLTQEDYKLFLENYNISDMEYIGGVWFPASVNLFAEYVEYWYMRKQTAKTPGQKRFAKMMLNSLSGSMGRHPKNSNMVIIDSGDRFDFKEVQSDLIPQSFVYVGSAITSYGRCKIIRAAQENYDRWLYSDTDSLQLKGKEPPKNIKISDELGDYKIEKLFDDIVYYKQKMYGYKYKGKYNFVFAGVPKQTTRFYTKMFEENVRQRSGRDDYLLPEDLEPDELIEFIDKLFAKEADRDELEEINYYMEKSADFYDKIDTLKNNKEPLRAMWFEPLPIWGRRPEEFQEHIYGFTFSISKSFNNLLTKL